MSKYSYLKKYVFSKGEGNWFESVKKDDIDRVEHNLNLTFPSQLKEFYNEIGYGFLIEPFNKPIGYQFYATNRINSPNMVEDILMNGPESGLIVDDVYEDLQPGDLPFFEIGDSSSFMVMKLNSDNPNAVWYMGAEKIEDSFERFIYRLYHEDPAYYAKDW